MLYVNAAQGPLIIKAVGLVWLGLYFGNVHIASFTFKDGHYPGGLDLLEDVASHRATV